MGFDKLQGGGGAVIIVSALRGVGLLRRRDIDFGRRGRIAVRRRGALRNSGCVRNGLRDHRSGLLCYRWRRGVDSCASALTTIPLSANSSAASQKAPSRPIAVALSHASRMRELRADCIVESTPDTKTSAKAQPGHDRRIEARSKETKGMLSGPARARTSNQTVMSRRL